MSEGSRPLLTAISPVYRGEHLVDKLVAALVTELSKVTPDYEIILVEDGSPDSSWQKIEENCIKNLRVKGVKLSRNFGQHCAISAGLRESKGDYVIVLDCDLQDNPAYIPALYAKAIAGYDIVYTSRARRQHSFLKNAFARMFFLLFNWLSDTQKATANVGGYSLLSRKVVDAFCEIHDTHRHYLMVLRWLGFKYTFVEIQHQKRLEGRSTYTFRKLVAHAINGITSQSDKLLRLAIGIGFLYFFISVVAASYLVVMYFLHGYKEGWASTIVLLLLSTGIILMAIGVAGIYIGKIFEQVKNRPLYLIDKKINF